MKNIIIWLIFGSSFLSYSYNKNFNNKGDLTKIEKDISTSYTAMDLPVNYENTSVNYTFGDFGGTNSNRVANPYQTVLNTSNYVASVTKSSDAKFWAGTTLQLANNIDFSSPKMIKILIWSPKVGAIIRMKCENVNDPNDFYEVDVTTTEENKWQELSYIFGGVSETAEYSKLSIFMDFGKTGDDTIYYFDNITIEDTEISEDKKWQLTFKDEFEGVEFERPNLSKWEAQSYNRQNNPIGPDGWWDSDDVYLNGNGNLAIRVKKIENRNSDDDPHDYSVGMIRSKNKFEQKFGKFEIRCKLPNKSGWWVAFWLFSDGVFNENGSGEDGTEIDIMEAFGWTDKIIHALHYDGYGSNHQSDANSNNINGLHDGFHTFSLEWNEDEYIFFVDGNQMWKTSFGGVSKVKSYVKITGEISTTTHATSQDWANVIDDNDFPDYFLIDYVKVYKKIDQTLGGNEIKIDTKVKLFPNPSNEFIQIFGLIKNESYKIYNILGVKIKSGNTLNNSKIDVKNLKNGIYFLKFKNKVAIKFTKE